MLAGLQYGTPVDIYIIGCIIRTVWGGDAAQPSVLAEGTFSPCVYEFDKNACSLKPWEYKSAIGLHDLVRSVREVLASSVAIAPIF